MKLIFLLLALIGWQQSTQAQAVTIQNGSDSTSRRGSGLLLGAGSSSFGYEPPFSKYTSPGYRIGIFTGRKLNRQYSLHLRLFLTRYGQRLFRSIRVIVPSQSHDSTTYYQVREMATYLTFSPQLRYRLPGRTSLKPFVSFGVFLGYRLSGKSKTFGGTGNYLGQNRETKSYQSLNWGTDLEIGAVIKLSPQNAMTVSVSLESGLTNTRKLPMIAGYDNALKTSFLSLNFAIPLLHF